MMTMVTTPTTTTVPRRIMHHRHHRSSSFKLLLVFAIGGIVLVFLVGGGDVINKSGTSSSHNSKSNDQLLTMKSGSSTGTTTIKDTQKKTEGSRKVAIQEGEIGMGSSSSSDNSSSRSRNIAYYHCSNDDGGGGGGGTSRRTTTENASPVTQSLVLLHGAAFTKEDWKTSGILKDLCRTAAATSVPLKVTAVDLPVSATHIDLIQLLNAMTDKDKIITTSSSAAAASESSTKLIESLPVTLVTPSASGKTITDWILNGDDNNSNKINLLPTYVSTWIPVASNSVDKFSDTQIIGLKDLSSSSSSSSSSSFKIFAIYGDQDGHGKKVSQRLQDIGGATILELSGRHPVYLDSPTEFVEAIIQNIKATN